mmetsp:Transcript_8460/g.24475  ORF Transcript_8460/g.24475 Transcript_8460/m.24475 type:complete len:264 (-) Transcript_8460:1415-2206(-)
MRSSARRGLPMRSSARTMDFWPLGTMAAMSAGVRSMSACMQRSMNSLQSSMSFLMDLFPLGSSMWCFSTLTSEARMGVRSPSSSSMPEAKAAAVFMTRPSSELLIFMSCRNVECSRRIPPLSGSGYIRWRKARPRFFACPVPTSVRSPPHLRTSSSFVALSRSSPVLASATGSHSCGLSCTLRLMPAMRKRPSTLRIWMSLWMFLTLRPVSKACVYGSKSSLSRRLMMLLVTSRKRESCDLPLTLISRRASFVYWWKKSRYSG